MTTKALAGPAASAHRPADERGPGRHGDDIGPLTPHLFIPHARRPLRAKLQHLRTDTRVVPHRHPWGQLALSSTGVVRLTVRNGSFIVPPSRALWIPPGMEHALTVLEDAALSSLVLPPTAAAASARSCRCGQDAAWRQCRVLEVSNLLRALVLEMDVNPTAPSPPRPDAQMRRERLLTALVLDELRRAQARCAWAWTCRPTSACGACAKPC